MRNVSEKRGHGSALKMIMALAVIWLMTSSASANPGFARRYSMDCTMCHTVVAKLNRFGWEFREAGFRLPSEIGKNPGTGEVKKVKAQDKQETKAEEGDGEAPAYKFSDMNSLEITSSYSLKYHGEQATPLKNTFRGALTNSNITAYLLTGAYDKHFYSQVEASIPIDVQKTYSMVPTSWMGLVYGDENGWAHVRIGVIPNLYGFGAADRGVGGSALFRSGPSVGVPTFTGASSEGIETGYYLKSTGTELSLHWNQGAFWIPAVSGLAAPGSISGEIGGSTLVKTTTDAPNGTIYTGDWSGTLTQFYGEENAVVLFGYIGAISALDPSTVSAVNNPTDTYTRLAGWANFWAVPEMINVLAGAGYSGDSPDKSTMDLSSGWGVFGAIDYHPAVGLAFEVRYDYNDPNGAVVNNKVQQFDLAANWLVMDGIFAKAEVTHKYTQIPGANKTLVGVNLDDSLSSSINYVW